MGYVGATVKLETVRAKMNSSRNHAKREWDNPKFQRFCADPEAFNIICRHYRYNYESWNGNVEGIHSDTYSQYYEIITDKENYQYLMELLKEDGINRPAEAKYLINGLRKLRQRYR